MSARPSVHAAAAAILLGGVLLAGALASLPIKETAPPAGEPAAAEATAEQPAVPVEPQSEQATPPPGERVGEPDILAPSRSAVLGGGLTYEAGQYVGPATCASANCHGNAQATDTYDVLQNEFHTWFQTDPHRRAADVLANEESRLIARNMGLAGPATRERACLVCHGMVVPKARQAVALEAEDGISCEGCHGPAGGWLARHNEAGWAHADSVAAGMVDLRNVRVRAELCLSCHLGDKSRQVDHELIAAGHPELVFELDNYSEEVSHWLAFAERRSTEGRANTHGARAWAAGQVHAFREGLLQLARRAETDRWPEFAEMSCDGCHHDLAGGEWRQRRGYRYRAGLPAWSPARWVVLRQLVAAYAPEEREALDAQVEAVAASVARMTPAEGARASAASAAEGLARVARQIEGASFSEERVRGLLAALAAEREALRFADRESAEQVALAVQSLVAYLAERQPRVAKGALGKSVEGLFAELEDPYRYDRERFAGALAGVEAALR